MAICRLCQETLDHVFADLGMSPLSNNYLHRSDLDKAEAFLPLKAYVCDNCKLVQLEEIERATDIFSDYAYHSSYSDSWLDHARDYVDMIQQRLALDSSSLVIEIASNDGYLLQYFQQRQVPCLGIEPAANVAEVAQEKGIATVTEFFGSELAAELKEKSQQADLLLGNNVLAHVPDINDFVAGLKTVLKDSGVITMEFPHLLRLIEFRQFDTIYHEHFSYLSLGTVIELFGRHDLEIFDVDEIPTHGGSLRIYGRHAGSGASIGDAVAKVLADERAGGLATLDTYLSFTDHIHAIKNGLLKFLIEAREAGKSVAAYGAPAKGNTLLNYCGVRQDYIDFTVDRSPHKQGRFLPGTHIPILAVEAIAERRPDYLLILPWNLRDEIVSQMSAVRDWGCRFVVAVPRLEVF